MGSVAHPRTVVGHASDLFVSCVNTIEVIGGGMVRVTFLVNLSGTDGRLHAEPADWALVMPAASFPDGIGKAIAATARCVFATPDGEIILRH